MSDKEYDERCVALFAELEGMLDAAGADYDNNGSVLSVNTDDGGVILINKQPPKWEVWLAAKTGGRHFRYVDGDWRDNRDDKLLKEQFRALLDDADGQ